MAAFHPLPTFEPSEMLIAMADVEHNWSLSNPGPKHLRLWLEPWAEQFDVPARSTIALSLSGGPEDSRLGEIEWTPDHLVVWANGPGTISVFVDGVPQESGSAVIPIPEGLTKQMLNVLFEAQPAARLGGATERISWWRRARTFLRF